MVSQISKYVGQIDTVQTGPKSLLLSPRGLMGGQKSSKFVNIVFELPLTNALQCALEVLFKDLAFPLRKRPIFFINFSSPVYTFAPIFIFWSHELFSALTFFRDCPDMTRFTNFLGMPQKGKKMPICTIRQGLLYTWTDSLGAFFATFVLMKISKNDRNMNCKSSKDFTFSKIWRVWLKN